MHLFRFTLDLIQHGPNPSKCFNGRSIHGRIEKDVEDVGVAFIYFLSPLFKVLYDSLILILTVLILPDVVVLEKPVVGVVGSCDVFEFLGIIDRDNGKPFDIIEFNNIVLGRHFGFVVLQAGIEGSPTIGELIPFISIVRLFPIFIDFRRTLHVGRM